MLKAITRSARLVDSRVASINNDRQNRGQGKISIAYFFDHFADDQDTHVSVVEEDFEQAKAELVPSVSIDELRHYERVRDTFEGTTRQAPEQAEKNSHMANDKAIAKARMAELIARTKASKKVSPVNGGDVVRDFAARPPSSKHMADSDDELVVRTEQLGMNGSTQRSPLKGKTRTKGKGKDRENTTSLDRRDGEDLYD